MSKAQTGEQARLQPRSELQLLLDLARNVPLHLRMLQLVNTGIAFAFCRPLGLIHVVEYPKCGGSWVRNMMHTYNGTQRFLSERLVRPRDVIQVHRLFRRSYRRPVVVVRDPRDLYVSFYYHETQYRQREKNLAIEHYFRHDPSRPLREDFASYLEAKLLHPTHPRFTFTQFVHSWMNRPRVCWVRYEDCLAGAETELTRIVRSLGLRFDPERVRQAVELNRFENATRARDGRARRPGEADPGEFERKGIAGDWKNHFSQRSCELIQRHECWTLRVLGYEADASWIGRFLDEQPAAG